jgi:hypothetical protein
MFTFNKKAVLKIIVDFSTLLIGAEGTKTPRKCYRISFVRGRIQGSKFNVLREDGAGETPQALAPRRLPGPPAESEVPFAAINRQVNTANKKRPESTC